jgi:hypothetical protein
MTCASFAFSNHAVVQMFKRNISAEDVEQGVHLGEIIRNYPQDQPYPSCLILFFTEDRPIHIVVSQDPVSQTCFIITTYIPDPTIWNPDFKSKI